MTKKSYAMRYTVLGTLISVLVPVILYYANLSVRSVSFEVTSKTNLTSSLNGIDALKVSINGKPLESAFLQVLSLTNTGNEPILPPDFEMPMRIKFDERVESAQIEDKKPKNLNVKYALNGNEIIIEPMLLNPYETFTIKAITGTDGNPVIDVRIAGISQVESSYPDEKKLALKFILVSTIFVLLIAYPFNIHSAIKGKNRRTISRIGQFLIGITCCLASVLLYKLGLVPIEGDDNVIIYVVAGLTSVLVGTLTAAKETYAVEEYLDR